jgi:hypothetical protein
MSNPVGTYTFLPWLRTGLVNQLIAGTGPRAQVNVILSLDGDTRDGGKQSVPISREVELYGPGDVVGVDRAQISRLEPAHWVTNFEPNYFAAVEFYDEDFPWRYTPAQPSGRRLLPWLALVVLEEGTEFKEGNGVDQRPLPYVELTTDFAEVFADPAEAWAWAHAHFNAELSPSVVETNAETVGQAAGQVSRNAPDSACSRLISPRKLKPKTAYHAFLVPAFESGRLAGLGRDPKPLFDAAANALTALSSAWGVYANRPDGACFPYYFRWYFRTADEGDFESLVRLLQPRMVDPRVGQRDMDVTAPSPNVSGIDDPALGGILRLGGALRAPLATLDVAGRADFEKYDQWDTPYPRLFQEQLAAFVNLAEGYQALGAAANADPAQHPNVQNDPDPMVVPPIYGRWHALTERLLEERDGSPVRHPENWVHDLNLDPRWRTAAGYGTKVVQTAQEDLMKGAWDQIGDVLEANRRIRQAQLARAAGRRLFEAHVAGAASVAPGALLMLTAPVKARVLTQGRTVRQQMIESPLHLAVTSSTMRRLLRPRARIARQLELTVGGELGTGALVAAVNDGAVSAAPPREPPAELLTPDVLASAVDPAEGSSAGAWLGAWLARHPRLVLLSLLLLVVLALVLVGATTFGVGVAVVLLALASAVASWARRARNRETAAGALRESAISPATVAALPGSSGFVLATHVDPRTAPAQAPLSAGETDNAEASRFKAALSDQYRVIEASRTLGALPLTKPLELAAVAADVRDELRPELTVPRWTFASVAIPPRILTQMGETFSEVMAYPEFDMPMYEPLVKAGSELLVPNLHLVEPNSVTLLETNQRFIEAYMVGLNHELARELLWREYPTDQRGSYFRQFWDVRKQRAAAPNPAAAREALRDIKPIHEWPLGGDLGDNDNRQADAAPREELVLVIRGELLKKYPNAIISAQPALWQLTDGRPDKSKERVLDESVTPLTPLYEARVAPDLFFFGFALTAERAKGDDSVDDQPGWFFRIEEVPGDARFGFDISRAAGSTINVWNDLAWPDVAPGLADGKPVKVSSIPPRSLIEPTGSDIEKHPQWEQDRMVPLDANMSAAELAYISLQAPVIVAIHASEMLHASA